MSVKITFHGACGTVTGSCFEVRNSRAGVLVDCGMFQGTKTVKSLNYEPFSFAPATISALLLTHAHVDHCGLIPRLVSAGFGGPILTTAPTADLLSYVLPDSGHIQELEIERVNRRNHQRGKAPVDPIYTRADAEASLARLKPIDLGKWITVAPGMRARLWDAGHILGSASIELAISDAGEAGIAADTMTILFSGDIGPGNKDFHSNPQGPAGVDYVVMESTYGARHRAEVSSSERRHLLREEIGPALEAHGLILIPAFAVERTQELLADIAHLFANRDIPRVPVFLDSPLAIRATEVFSKYLGKETGDNAFNVRDANVHFVDDVSASRKLSQIKGGAIIMAGSGMCDAGRIRHHLKAHLSEPTTTLLLVGYQAPGTLGRLLADGASMVRIQGDEINVTARVRSIDQYSGHADQERLAAWVKARSPVKHNVILVHGEDAARAALCDRLVGDGMERSRVILPALGETLGLTAKGADTVSVNARLPSLSAIQSDWHNQFSQDVLALRDKLEKAGDDAVRQRLLERVAAAIQG